MLRVRLRGRRARPSAIECVMVGVQEDREIVFIADAPDDGSDLSNADESQFAVGGSDQHRHPQSASGYRVNATTPSRSERPPTPRISFSICRGLGSRVLRAACLAELVGHPWIAQA